MMVYHPEESVSTATVTSCHVLAFAGAKVCRKMPLIINHHVLPSLPFRQATGLRVNAVMFAYAGFCRSILQLMTAVIPATL